jgi:hypothetical protein
MFSEAVGKLELVEWPEIWVQIRNDLELTAA